MSGKDENTIEARTDDESTENIESDQEPAVDAPEELETDTVEQQSSSMTPTERRGSAAVAWIALFVSLALAVVVATFAYLSYRDAAGDAAQSSTEINTLRASIGATQDALTSLEQRIVTLGESDAEKDAAIDSISRQLNERLRQLESVPGRLSAVESSMATIQGISTGARNAWLLAEAEYYMQIANAQLQLANNPELAGLALTHADDRITQLADPRLTNVRQALADELRALKAIDRPDTAGITLTLASLAGVVDSLPLRQEVVVNEDRSAEIDPELSGMDRAIASLKNAVGGVVSVRRTDEAMQPLIAPEAQYFLRANLALQLQAARLALLRGEESIFRQSLDDADSWLDEYYDPSSKGVQDARKTIAEMRDSVLSVAMPDISGSLRLLRQFSALDESTPADDTEPAQ